MNRITQTVRLFLSQALLNEATIAEDPALADIIDVRDNSNPQDLILFAQNEASVEFGIPAKHDGEKAVSTHILSLQKNRHGQNCIMLSYYNADDKIEDIERVIVDGDNATDDGKRLLRSFQLTINQVTSFENLVERCFRGQDEFFIAIGGGLARSSKHIVLADDEIDSLDFANLPTDLELSVFHEIDESEDIVNRSTIAEKTNIMTAIENGAMFAY